MDPDAYGSLTGFYQILETLWKKVIALNDQAAPDDFAFMWMNHVFTESIPTDFTPNLIISFDASSLWQLADSYLDNKKLFDTTDFFVIDHHITNPWFGQYNIIKTHYSSTCEITYELLEELWYIQYITPKIASCLYSGIITDTNVFYNKNTTANTHRVAAKLIEHWADFRAPIYEFYKKQTLDSLQFDTTLINNIQQTNVNSYKIYYILIDLEVFDKAGIAYEFGSVYTKNFIWSTLANIEWWDICFILYPLKDWTIKASFRSKEYDVSALCQSFGWWWHKLAAGCSYEWEIEEFKSEILRKIEM